MKLRNLRIAWSVMCGILCLLLFALWARSSYFKADILIGRMGNVHVRIDSGIGFFAIQVPRTPRSSKWVVVNADDFHGNPGHSEALGFPRKWDWRSSKIWGHFEISLEHRGICFPYWSLVISAAALAAAPWLRWRFTLRTLLIGTTVVATVLALAIALRPS